MSSLFKIKDEILKAKKIGLSFHTSPDGDAIGSTLGLLNGLKCINKEAYIITRDVISDNFSFLPLSEQITNDISKPTNDTDLVIVLDCGNVDRISADLNDYNGKIINIDHHISNEMYGDINYVDANASAACELSYLLMKELGINFTKKSNDVIGIGKCIYTGLVTDTGSFRHSNVTHRTHEIAGELIELGVENSKIHSQLFDNKPFQKIQLMGRVFSEAKLEAYGKIFVAVITKNIIEELDLANNDTSDIVSMGLGIKGIEVSVLFKEVDEGIKASLRSKNDVDVRKIAEIFGGGGHIKASGVMQKGITLSVAKDNLINAIKDEILNI